MALADGNGDNTFRRAFVLASLGYRTIIIRDNDKAPSPEDVTEYVGVGGTVLQWANCRALEQELFCGLSDGAAISLLDYAIEQHGEKLIDDHVKSASSNNLNLDGCRDTIGDLSTRCILGMASKAKKNRWFKSITAMEHIGQTIVGPDLQQASKELRDVVEQLFQWATGGGR